MMQTCGASHPADALQDAWASAPFVQMDAARRLLGAALEYGGFGQYESPFRIVAGFPGARLRAYQGERARGGAPALIVAAPFKRPYIWDLRPQVSVVRRLRERGLRVYLLEWVDDASADAAGLGLADFADRTPEAAFRAIARETGVARPLLAGHSVGGVFAAIYAALHPETVGGLLLIEAPLSLGEFGGALARAARLAPPARLLPASRGRVCGSMIDVLSVWSAPEAFYWEPALDWLASVGNARSLAILTAVRRWTLDEYALPRQLFVEISELLYREDQLSRGVLRLNGTRVDLARIQAPVLAVVNRRGRVVTAQSALDALVRGKSSVDVMTFSPERGTMFEHVAALVGRRAHAELWPRIVDWLEARS
jgi:polyhydroxyalkanoate synthase